MNTEKVKQYLSEILYAEHQGDVNRSVSNLAVELGLPRPVWNEDRELYDHEELWPWDIDEEDE